VVAIQLKPGMKLFSCVCTAELVVVRAAPDPVDLRCGGEPLATAAPDPATRTDPQPGFDSGTLLGKRYADDDGTFELLSTKPGSGSLSVGEGLLELKGAKPLPASD
jgi:hypothetical protein